MKRLFLLFLLLPLSLPIWGQGKQPLWVDAQNREAHYPQTIYLTGFASETKSPNENMEAAIVRLKKIAQAELVRTILVKITAQDILAESSVQINSSEEFHQKYVNWVTTESSAKINGAITESYYDKRTKTIYAFAYANRQELAMYYQNSIDQHLQQAAGALKTAGQLEHNMATKGKAL
jgi:hypothetical protein